MFESGKKRKKILAWVRVLGDFVVFVIVILTYFVDLFVTTKDQPRQ